MKPEVHKATLKDLDELNHLFDAYRVFYNQVSDKDQSREFLKSRMENEESVIFISRNDSKTATGFTQLYPLFSSTRMKRVWLLNDLFVKQEYRGQGFSKALIEQAKKLCRETKAVGMMLETDKSNTIGNRLYVKTGWKLDKEHNFYHWEVD